MSLAYIATLFLNKIADGLGLERVRSANHGVENLPQREVKAGAPCKNFRSHSYVEGSNAMVLTGRQG